MGIRSPFLKKHNIAMMHLCYIYIESYKKLRQVGIAIDSHYQYDLDIQSKCLAIEGRSSNPSDFWGVGIHSLSAIVGGNGVG